jgi:glucan phosphoethanolaminetransferase (alkaline phosphatase superfamily)
VFEEILGIPAHPLLIHAAVVFIPLQVAAAIAYAAVPFTRRYIWWVVLALAVIAPGAAWFAKLSGTALKARLIRNGVVSNEFLPKIDQHNSFGDMTAYFSTALGVLMLLMVLVVTKRPAEGERSTSLLPAGSNMVVSVLMMVGIIVIGGFTGYYVFRTGDSGAHMIWEGL